GQPAITRGLDRLDGLCRGRRQPVKGLDRLSGDWRAIKRAPIALDRLPPPATKTIQAIKAVAKAARP
ncbi:MAG TPA: hypothetical protein VKT99_02870, partial [Xanthobacteraceae bacterium]|nr:hypothetical protein [Xanthobacteraceae bacterium]